VRRRRAVGLLALYWIATLLPLLGLAKVGSNYNYWIEFAGPTAVFAAVGLVGALDRQSSAAARGQQAALVLVAANLALLTVLLGPSLLSASLRHARDDTARTQFAALVERVRAEPGEVLAAPLDVVSLAGRRVLFEPYIFSLWFSAGEWDPAPLINRICEHDVALLVLDRSVDQPVFEYHDYSSWPAPIISALRQTAVLEARYGDRYVYRLVRACTSPAASY
jgi:hypothetical protein